ncbi:MAG TPA: acyltransferase [Micromonosporaceae bacterium]|nr:acyltransferase [Micromonosporaceae bacterium]
MTRVDDPSDTGTPAPTRVTGLDGIRGLAALYVLLHHCWLLSFSGYPENTGPWALGWLVYGRFAVVLFIALSGFSLAISPAARGWRLGGRARYIGRRARRILPAYWAALALSLVLAWAFAPQPLSDPPDTRTAVVYGLLLQDVVVAPVPNAALWSIAVEAWLYVAFPLLLLIRRRLGAVAVLAAVTVPVVALGLLFPEATDGRSTGYTVELAPLFTVGLVAAGVLAAGERVRGLPWHWLALLALVPVVVLIAVQGSVWTAHHFYWIDLALGPAIAAFLAAVATGRPRPLARLLDSRPVRGLGRFSYSLYLIHVPIAVLVSRRLVAPLAAPGLPAFLLTLAVAVPVCLVAARLFSAAFEWPFQRLGRRGAAKPVAAREPAVVGPPS